MPGGDCDGMFGRYDADDLFSLLNMGRFGGGLVCYAWRNGAGAGSGVRSGEGERRGR